MINDVSRKIRDFTITAVVRELAYFIWRIETKQIRLEKIKRKNEVNNNRSLEQKIDDAEKFQKSVESW